MTRSSDRISDILSRAAGTIFSPDKPDVQVRSFGLSEIRLPYVLSALSSAFSVTAKFRDAPPRTFAEEVESLAETEEPLIVAFNACPDDPIMKEARSTIPPLRHGRARFLFLNGGQTWFRGFGTPFEEEEFFFSLQGKGPLAVTKLTMEMGAEILTIKGISESLKEGRIQIREAFREGRVINAFREKLACPAGVTSPLSISLHEAGEENQYQLLKTRREGHLASIDIKRIRSLIRKYEAKGIAMGFRLAKDVGDPVESSERLAELSTLPRMEIPGEIIHDIFDVKPHPLPYFPLILERIDV